jgi:hypothetical protein
MRIYFGHSSNMDYKRLYNLIKNYESSHDMVLPHEFSKDPFVSKDFMKGIQLFIAEVSLPSTGLGIELAWAKDADIPIFFFYKKGSKISDCLKLISKNFVEYDDDKDFIEKFIDVVNQSSS